MGKLKARLHTWETNNENRASQIRLTFGRARRVASIIFPQWLRTALVTLLWLGTMLIYVRLVASYDSYSSALTMGVGLALFTGFAVHLWPPRTSPWRTVAWTALLTALAGSALLTLHMGRLTLPATTAIGAVFVLLRLNSNGRSLVRLVRHWRTMR